MHVITKCKRRLQAPPFLHPVKSRSTRNVFARVLKRAVTHATLGCTPRECFHSSFNSNYTGKRNRRSITEGHRRRRECVYRGHNLQNPLYMPLCAFPHGVPLTNYRLDSPLIFEPFNYTTLSPPIFVRLLPERAQRHAYIRTRGSGAPVDYLVSDFSHTRERGLGPIGPRQRDI